MLAGLSAALGAGLLWGLVFLTPLLLADYPPFMLAIGRYLAFGVLALGLAWFDRAALARLTRANWIEAVKLALIGNLLAPAFYAGDTIGSFNWWARLLTGLLASFAFVRQVYPLLDWGFAMMARTQQRNR
ncbi:MAG TPA: hypothetical protein PLG56_09130 [Lacunisphaera sp.]|nr:hypothetical protein [Lacunisphaera sp.]